MFCVTCGAENHSNYRNCTQCGSPNKNVEKLLTSEDVAELLGVSVGYIKDHCTRMLPRIPHINIGTKKRALRRFERSEILKFIAFTSQHSRGGPLR